MPLLSWYHSGFDTEPDLSDPRYLEVEQVRSHTLPRRLRLLSPDGSDASIIISNDFELVIFENSFLKLFALSI